LLDTGAALYEKLAKPACVWPRAANGTYLPPARSFGFAPCHVHALPMGLWRNAGTPMENMPSFVSVRPAYLCDMHKDIEHRHANVYGPSQKELKAKPLAGRIGYYWQMLQIKLYAYREESIRHDVKSLVGTCHTVNASQGSYVSMQVS
jgi:hypothetical protein